MTHLIMLTLIGTIPERAVFETTIDGVRRSAIVRVPSDPKGKPHPLVFVFHGHGGTSRFSERKYPIHEMWPESISIHPQGLPTKTGNDPQGNRAGWQINPGDYGDRDLKLFDALLNEAKSRANVDPSRIYVMGHSNGARFTYVLWSKRPKVFAATGPMAAPGSGLIQGLEPISTFVLAGEKDPIVNFRGQMLSLDLLKSNYAFTNKSAEKVDGFGRYRKADNGTTLATYIHPGGHEVPQEAVRQIVEFFKSETRPTK